MVVTKKEVNDLNISKCLLSNRLINSRLRVLLFSVKKISTIFFYKKFLHVRKKIIFVTIR